MKKLFRIVSITIKATIYWNLLMMLLKMSQKDPFLLETLIELTIGMEDSHEED